MESAKEKAIREAWIEIVGEDNFHKLRLNDKGYSDWHCRTIAIKAKIDDLESILKSPSKTGNDLLYRPRKLKGIENNAGWQRIESEADLPAEDSTEYFIVDKIDGQIYSGVYYYGDGVWLKGELGKNPTHYQPVNYPNLPIY